MRALKASPTWGEADISDWLVVPCERVHKLPRGHIEDGHCAVHDAARQAPPVWAECYAQHILLPLVLLIRLPPSGTSTQHVGPSQHTKGCESALVLAAETKALCSSTFVLLCLLMRIQTQGGGALYAASYRDQVV